MIVDRTRQKDPGLKSKFRAEIYAFDPETPYWGAGGAEIVDIMLVDDNGQKVQTIEGGAPVNIRVVARSNQQLINPIVGFSLRNQRGVYLISENTSNAGGVFPTIIAEGVEFYGEFQFFLPYLPVGEYFLGGAVADRPSGEMHLQHHRRDDALRISVLNSHVVFGTFSMPMDNCEIKVDGASDFRLGRGDKMGDP
jgi:lipopolysaccharide transport system ATP-binding protein